MALKTEGLESELIDSVCAQAREKVSSEEEAERFETFVRQYYHWVPADDLADRSTDELYCMAAAHWRLAQERQPGEAKVRVYNPDAEKDGYRSSHTVVEIVSDDMPFLVDSVTMELNRQGYGMDLVIHPMMRFCRD